MEAPDNLGFIVGLRAWRQAETDKGWRLQSAVQGFVWPPGKRLEAECLPLRAYGPMAIQVQMQHHPPGLLPAENCKCGFWGLALVNEVYKQFGAKAFKKLKPDSERYVYGTVALWGRVLVGTLGWRAQYATPLALVAEAASLNNRGLLSHLSGTYGIPIVDNWPDASEIVAQ